MNDEPLDAFMSETHFTTDMSQLRFQRADSAARKWIAAYGSIRREARQALRRGDRATTKTAAPRFSPEDLSAVLSASNELTLGTMGRNSEELCSFFVRKVRDILRCESCVLFLARPDTEGILDLKASSSDAELSAFVPASIKCHLVEPDEAAFDVCADGHAYRIELLDSDAASVPRSLEYLASGKGRNRLAEPILDRKGRMRGLVKADHRLNGNSSFGDTDRFSIRLLINQFVVSLEHLQTSESLNSLISGISGAQDEDDFFDTLLQKSVALVGADRGDFLIWDDQSKDLIIRFQRNEAVSAKIGTRVPNTSVVRDVWASGGYLYLPQVAGTHDGAPSDFRTKSQLVVRVDVADRLVGVLNVESFRSDGFDARDIELLSLLSEYASIAFVRAMKDIGTRGVLKQLCVQIDPPAEVLKRVLELIDAYLGLDASLIYCAAYGDRELRCIESHGCGDCGVDAKKFVFSFDDASLACKVFHERVAYYSADPASDPVVSPRGLGLFEISGPLVGVPLLYRDQVVGVLVTWSRGKVVPSPDFKERLEPFAQLAAPSIATNVNDLKRKTILKAADDILHTCRMTNSDEQLLVEATQQIRQFGFDRVRLFKFDPVSRAFIGWCSAGMAEPERFKKAVVRMVDNPYAKHTVDTAALQPQARIYDSRQFGVDPSAGDLEKGPEDSWMVVPLVVQCNLFGQIVVDNAISGHAFTPTDTEYLNLMASVLAETLSHIESRDAMRQRALTVLLRHISDQDTIEAIMQRLLVFSTSSQGLSFSRAVYLEYDDRRRRLVYSCGIGSINSERFVAIAREAVKLGLDELLQLAVSVSDDDLNNALVDYEFNWDFAAEFSADYESCRTVDLHRDSSGWGCEMAKALMERICGEHFLASPLWINNEFRGLLIADRAWQGRKLDEGDRAKLEGFSRLAGYLITEHERKRRFLQNWRDDALLGRLLGRLMVHGSRQFRDMSCDAHALSEAFLRHDHDEIVGGLSKLTSSLHERAATWEAFEMLVDKRGVTAEMHPRTLVNGVVRLLQAEAVDNGVEIAVKLPASIDKALVVVPGLLLIALIEIVTNAIEATRGADIPKRHVGISAECDKDELIVRVIDSGRGISADILKQCRAKDAYTGNLDKGLGFGLITARRIVEDVHGGSFVLDSPGVNQGTSVIVKIPRVADGKTTARAQRLMDEKSAAFS